MNTNERPTPETDAFYGGLYAAGTPLEMVEIASGEEKRKMQQFERQRDEARDRIAQLETQLAELQNPKKPKEQDTFEAHGMTWIKHTPGEPIPCNPEARILAITNWSMETGHASWVQRANQWNWSDSLPEDCQIIGWNYADAP